MTKNNPFRLNPEVGTTLTDFLARAEGTTDKTGKTSIVRNGDSGLSVGRIQMDLSKHTGLADRLVAIGKANGVAGADEITADMLKQKHGTFMDKDGKYDEARISKIEKFAASVLETREGERALKNAEDTQVRTVAAKVEEACGQAGPNAQKFCASPQGQRELAAYIHQYGTGNIDKLKAYLRSEEVTLGEGGKDEKGTKVQLTQELTPESFRSDYRNTTLYAQKNPVPIATRDKNVDAANERFPIQTPQPEKRSDAEGEAPATPQAVAQDRSSEARDDADTPMSFAEAQPASAQTPTQSLQQPMQRSWEAQPPRTPFNFLDPTMKSPRYNLPSGLAALLGVPHAPGGSPDGAFADLAKQVGGDGLPPLVSDLLGAGVSRTNPKSAVKLFQTTINALNKPDAFDWNWSTSGKIDVDGDLGPQTRAGFGRALEKAGPEGFARKFALGQFRDYATKLDNGIERYENLAGAVDGSLGRVDRNAAATFQDYLNIARDNLPPHVRYEGLKRDGWIGPKTTDAFKTALYNLGPKTIADDLEGLFA
jgi:hypothetical protein